MDFDEFIQDRRIALSFYKVEGLEWSKDYNKIMKLLEKETKKKVKGKDIKKGVREFKAKDEEEKFNELRMGAIIDVAKPIKIRVVKNDEIIIKDSIFYEPRPIFSIFRYESSILIIFAKEIYDASRFITYFLDIIGGGVYFRKLTLGKKVMEYFLKDMEEIKRLRIELPENKYIDDILLKGTEIQLSEEYHDFKERQKGEILELGLKKILGDEKLVRINIGRNGRIIIYKGNTDITQTDIENLISIVEKRYELK